MRHIHAVEPLAVVGVAMEEDLHALFAMLRDRLAQTVNASDAVSFGVHDPLAVLVASDPTFREAGA